MKKSSAIVLMVVMLICVLLLGSCALIPDVQARELTDYQEASFTGYIPGSGSWDATDFLVGEFYNSTGEVTRFDGRGTVTVIAPDGVNSVGLYSMTESDGKEAVVHILMNGEESSYEFDLVSSQGDFTLTDAKGNLSIYTPVQY